MNTHHDTVRPAPAAGRDVFQGGDVSPSGDRLVSAKEASEVLGVSSTWLYDRIARGEIPSYRMGRAIRLKRSDLTAFLEARRQGGDV